MHCCNFSDSDYLFHSRQRLSKDSKQWLWLDYKIYTSDHVHKSDYGHCNLLPQTKRALNSGYGQINLTNYSDNVYLTIGPQEQFIKFSQTRSCFLNNFMGTKYLQEIEKHDLSLLGQSVNYNAVTNETFPFPAVYHKSKLPKCNIGSINCHILVILVITACCCQIKCKSL